MTKVDDLRDALKKRKIAKQTHRVEQPSVDTDGEDVLDVVELAGTATPEEAGADDLLERLQTAEAQSKEHHDRLLRTLAEFDNFRKRVEREQADMAAYANERLLRELMPILDHLHAALDHIPATESGGEAVQVLAEGVELTRKELTTVLEKFGFQHVPAAVGDKFDPSLHEALAQVDAADVASNADDVDPASAASEKGRLQPALPVEGATRAPRIVAVQRCGYTLQGRLLRPALVIVAK